jgi:hypothetical protein
MGLILDVLCLLFVVVWDRSLTVALKSSSTWAMAVIASVTRTVSILTIHRAAVLISLMFVYHGLDCVKENVTPLSRAAK